MNGKKAKDIRRVVEKISHSRKLVEFGLLARPANPKTAIVAPQSKRGITLAIKRSIKKGK